MTEIEELEQQAGLAQQTHVAALAASNAAAALVTSATGPLATLAAKAVKQASKDCEAAEKRSNEAMLALHAKRMEYLATPEGMAEAVARGENRMKEAGRG